MPATLPEPLTLRQLELIVHVANGLTFDEIAEAEGISPRTVANTLNEARQRAHARNLPNLVAIVMNAGLLMHYEDVPDPE